MTTNPVPYPFLVTLGFDPATFERLDRLRTRYFPADRNQVPAHVSLFHHLPGDDGDAIDRELTYATQSHAPIPLTFPGIKRMGRGVLATLDAPGLNLLHARLARRFAGSLTPQDRQPFRPHVTLMNKAEPPEVDAAFAELQATWTPWTGTGDHLILWRYLGGPWEEVESYPLAGLSTEES